MVSPVSSILVFKIILAVEGHFIFIFSHPALRQQEVIGHFRTFSFSYVDLCQREIIEEMFSVSDLLTIVVAILENFFSVNVTFRLREVIDHFRTSFKGI